MNLDKVKKITEDEVWNAIETMPQNKSPEIDGLPVEFYKKIWPWLKEAITIMFNNTLDTEELSKTQTTGIITLLHKGGSRKILSNRRPISLLCSNCKMLTKILTLRLKNILPYIIVQEQTGGLANRDISQNLTTYRKIIEWFSSQDTYKGSNLREKGVAIGSMDFEKPYNMVDHTFLYEVLLKMGFSEIFIRNIKSLYEKSFSKVYVNGEMGKKIDLKRGVRQGCQLPR
ncbi:Pol-like protein [Daphnia magna]|uniref:Pol-like protein n=1 Tax=Daphnia magna TaxID=35525 RepID=A0A162CY01_9CRUS|nr:Pol-like protein [Daphnia magna]